MSLLINKLNNTKNINKTKYVTFNFQYYLQKLCYLVCGSSCGYYRVYFNNYYHIRHLALETAISIVECFNFFRKGSDVNEHFFDL